MTTTLSSARTRLRTGLEDSSGSPLWADATLDEGLKRTLDEYSQWSPDEATSTFTATAGDLTASVPTGALRIKRIIDPNGWVIPEAHGAGLRYVGDLELSWTLFADTIRFARALIAGDYTIWYLTAHAWPANDSATFTIPDSDIPLLIAGATVYALEVRGRQEWKRGPLPARYSEAMREASAAYSAAWRERRRTVRSSTLGVTG